MLVLKNTRRKCVKNTKNTLLKILVLKRSFYHRNQNPWTTLVEDIEMSIETFLLLLDSIIGRILQTHVPSINKD